MSAPKFSFADKDTAYVVFDRDGFFVTMMTTPDAAERLIEARSPEDGWYMEEWERVK